MSEEDQYELDIDPTGYCIMVRRYWESADRWYAASLVKDMFGDWIIVRRWGGKNSKRNGTKTILVASEKDGFNELEKLNKERLKRKARYQPVEIKQANENNSSLF